MKELKEIEFGSVSNINLENHKVKSAILPQTALELDREIRFRGDAIVEGAIYGHKIEIETGNIIVEGAAFAKLELHVHSTANGKVVFKKSVGAVNSIVSHSNNCRLIILGDVNAKEVRLNNAFIAGSIFGDEINLTDCVVIGGVFASKELTVKHSIMGTFNAHSVIMNDSVDLLLPSAFSIEPINYNKSTTALYNFSLADLGALFKGTECMPNTGKIKMDLESDEIKSTLTDDNRQMLVRSYTVVGKVLAADLIDWTKMQNHFLITAGSLNSQLLDTFDIGTKADGTKAELTYDELSEFFFNILNRKIEIPDINGTFNIEDFAK